MADPMTSEYILIGANALIYILLFLQVVRREAGRAPVAGGMSGAFEMLGVELNRRIPEMPPGYTWREAVAEVKKRKLKVDWKKVGSALASYEAVRYGGEGEDEADCGEILVLAKELRSSR